MTEAEKAAVLDAARNALMICPDDALKLVADDGTSAAERVSRLKEKMPHLFHQHVRELSAQAAAQKLAELKREPKLPPMPTDRRAEQMSPGERARFIRAANLR